MLDLLLKFGIGVVVLLLSTQTFVKLAKNISLAYGFVRKGDIVVMTAGLPAGKSGTTNIVKAFVI